MTLSRRRKRDMISVPQNNPKIIPLASVRSAAAGRETAMLRT